VGHNPTMEATVHALAGDDGGADDAGADDAGADGAAVRDRLSERGFPTAAVATLTYNGDWAGIGPGTCRLEGFDVGRG